MSPDQGKAYYPLQSSMQDLVAALIRTVKAAKLYASGHELFKQNVDKLHGQILEAVEDRDFLFLGIAKDALFLEGSFYQAKDVTSEAFLIFFTPSASLIFFLKRISLSGNWSPLLNAWQEQSRAKETKWSLRCPGKTSST